MIDFRKLLVALVIAVLFAIFVNTTIEAFSPSPKWDTYCNTNVTGVDPSRYGAQAEPVNAQEKQQIDTYYQKQTECQAAYQNAQERHDFVVFLVSAIAGLIAIIAGLYVPVSSPVGMSIATGFMLGGLFALFFGTIRGWGGIGLTFRPIVMLVELAVVILIAYKQLNSAKKTKKA